MEVVRLLLLGIAIGLIAYTIATMVGCMSPKIITDANAYNVPRKETIDDKVERLLDKGERDRKAQERPVREEGIVRDKR